MLFRQLSVAPCTPRCVNGRVLSVVDTLALCATSGGRLGTEFAGYRRRRVCAAVSIADMLLVLVTTVSEVHCANVSRLLFAHRFVVVSLLGTKHQTPVSKRTVNPTYNPKDATFDFPIYLSLADKLGVLELVVWDKDVLKKDYLGEAWIPLEDWFRDGNAFAFDDLNNKVCLLFVSITSGLPLPSSRTTARVSMPPVMSARCYALPVRVRVSERLVRSRMCHHSLRTGLGAPGSPRPYNSCCLVPGSQRR